MAEHQVQELSLKSVDGVPKFDGTNIREWRHELNLRNQYLGIHDIVEGTELRPEEVISRRIHISHVVSLETNDTVDFLEATLPQSSCSRHTESIKSTSFNSLIQIHPLVSHTLKLHVT